MLCVIRHLGKQDLLESQFVVAREYVRALLIGQCRHKVCLCDHRCDAGDVEIREKPFKRYLVVFVHRLLRA